MFFQGSHDELSKSIEAIGASFAVYEYNTEQNNFFLVSCNSLYEEILSKSIQEAIDKPIDSIFPRYIAKPLLESFFLCKREQIASEKEILLEYKTTERWWRSVSSPIINTSENKIRVIQTCVEITEKKQLEKKLTTSLRRFEAVVQSAYDGIITIDEEQNIKMINDAAKQIFALDDDSIIGTPLTRLIPQRFRKPHKGYVEAFRHSQIDSRPMQSRASVRGLRQDGSEFPIEVTISKIHIEEKTEMTAVIRDISEKNQLMEELLISSQRDPLTNLYNRRYFTETLEKEIARSKRYTHNFSLMMVDIDNFKSFNDTYGHECGDNVLKHFSLLLESTLRETDITCRWGGEEFLVLLPEIDSQAILPTAENLRTAVESSEFMFSGKSLKITISIGTVFCTPENMEINELIKKADNALYQAKSKGRNKVINLD